MTTVDPPVLFDLDDKTFDPFVVEKSYTGHVVDPYATYRRLQAEGPVHKLQYTALFTDVPNVQVDDLEQYIVLGYDAIAEVFSQPETYTNYEAFRHTLGKSFGRTITVMDAPEHGRFRRIFQKAFLPNVVAKWGESVVDPVIDRLVSRFLPKGRADLVEDFTHHYPFQVIYSQLDIGPEQAPIFHKLAVAQLLSALGAPQGPEATEKLGQFFSKLVALRRKNPGEDLISQLALAEVDGEYLPEEVLVSFLRQLLNAGGDTTFRGTSSLLTGLLTNPDQLAAVQAERSLLPRAIDEALRWEGPVTVTYRHVSRDTELGGCKLPEGALLSIVLSSANRDASKFADPDKFNIFREHPARVIPFGSGPHVCIGQHLARLEMLRAMNGLLDRVRNLRLDPDMPPPVAVGHQLRTSPHIHVLFDPA